MGGDAQQLGQAAGPHHVGLQDVDGPALDQPAEAVAGIFMLAGGEARGGQGALQQAVALDVVGVQHLLPPMDAEIGAGGGQLDGVGHVERHVAVDHQREVRPHGGAVPGQELAVRPHPAAAVGGAVRQRHLAAPEAHALGLRGQGPGAVEAQLRLGPAADQLVDRLLPDLADQVPQRQVDHADGGQRQPLAAVEHAGAEHLVPQQVQVARVGADQEAAEMLLDQPAGRRAAEAGGEADAALVVLDLDQDRAQHVDAPAQPRRLVGRIARHRVGDQRVDDPVAALLAVIVAAVPGAFDQMGADVGDARCGHDGVRRVAGTASASAGRH